MKWYDRPLEETLRKKVRHEIQEFTLPLEKSWDQFSVAATAPLQLLAIKGARCCRAERALVLEPGTAA